MSTPKAASRFELGQNEEFALLELDLDRVERVRDRGTRGLTRNLQHARTAPPAAFAAYRRFFADA